MESAGLGSVGASGALRHSADWSCEQGIDFRSRPETLFRSGKILKQHEMTGERAWRLALPMNMIEIDCRRTDALRDFLRQRALARSAVANDHDPRSEGHDR